MTFFKDLIASGKVVPVKDYVAPVAAEDMATPAESTTTTTTTTVSPEDVVAAPSVAPVETDNRFPTVKALDKGPDFKPAKTTYQVVKESIETEMVDRSPQYRLKDTGEPLTYEQATAALSEAVETTILEQVGEPVNLNKELKDFGLQFDISRSDNPMEVYKKIENSYPKSEGYNIKVVDYSGQGDWVYLLKGPQDDEWYPVNKPGVSLADVGTVAGSMANEGTIAATVGSALTGGAVSAIRIPVVTILESLGAYGREKVEQARGYQTNTEAEMGETALREGLIGGLMEVPASILTRTRDLVVGAKGIFAPTSAGKRAMEIAQERGYRQLTPGMIGGITKVMEKQKAAFAPEISQRAYQEFQEELTKDLERMFQENASKGLSNESMLILHNEMIDEINEQAKVSSVDVLGFGEALQEVFNKNYIQKQALKFSEEINGIYRSAKGDVSFDLTPVKEIAESIKGSGIKTRAAPETKEIGRNLQTGAPITATVTDETGKITVGAQDQLISPAMASTLKKLENIDVNMRDLKGTSGLEQLHALRKEFDQFAWETSDAVTSADRRAARQVRAAITDVLMKAEGGGEVFQQQFKKFNKDYTAFAEIRDYSQLQRLVETDNPAQIAAQLIASPTDKDMGKMLKFLNASLPSEDFRMVRDAAKSSLIMGEGGLSNLSQRLAHFDTNPAVRDLLFSPREFADLKALSVKSDVLALPKVQKAVQKTSDNVALGQKLIKELTLPEFEALAAKGGEPFRATMKAGFIADLWEKSQSKETITRGGTEVSILSNKAFGETVSRYMNTITPEGKIFHALFSEAERKELSDIQFWAQQVGSVNTDSGAILTVAAKVANLGIANLLSNPKEFGATVLETQSAKLTAATWFSPTFSTFIFGNKGPTPWASNSAIRATLTGLNSGLSKLPLSDQFLAEDTIPEELKDKIKTIKQNGQTVTPVQQQQELTPEDREFFRKNRKNLTPVNTKIKFTPLSATYSEDIPMMSEEDAIISNELTGPSTVQEIDASGIGNNNLQGFDDVISNELTGPSTVVPIDGGPSSKFLDMQGVFDKERLFAQGVPVAPELGNRILAASPELGEYMVKSMKLESAGGKMLDGAIASGYFQFVASTWPSYAKKAGVKQMNPKKATLEEQVKVMEAFTKSNAQQLKNFLGRDPSHGELYLAHHFGATGSKELIEAARKTPNKPAKNFVSKDALKHNKSLIEDKTAGELVRYLELSFRRGQFAKNHSLERQIAALR